MRLLQFLARNAVESITFLLGSTRCWERFTLTWSNEAPVQIEHDGRIHSALIDDLRSVQHPHAQLTGRVVLPEEIRVVVVIHVANPANCRWR